VKHTRLGGTSMSQDLAERPSTGQERIWRFVPPWANVVQFLVIYYILQSAVLAVVDGIYGRGGSSTSFLEGFRVLFLNPFDDYVFILPRLIIDITIFANLIIAYVIVARRYPLKILTSLSNRWTLSDEYEFSGNIRLILDLETRISRL
jgi:hypothetical protein